ncbi:hypothetical protein AVEN_214712-1 [Araneus ventricosus]|uniref:Uncharacterized protein n=1 Tax=Araneus ventricosus TaxID=182803 RepID=A0A4Y2VJR8_ARAVE|nr:hypothetical protein AVEN_214712-1 [Araneus ventricosus]
MRVSLRNLCMRPPFPPPDIFTFSEKVPQVFSISRITKFRKCEGAIVHLVLERLLSISENRIGNGRSHCPFCLERSSQHLENHENRKCEGAYHPPSCLDSLHIFENHEIGNVKLSSSILFWNDFSTSLENHEIGNVKEPIVHLVSERLLSILENHGI